jgi:glyceraldehyde-3-phosphate dehydrogenase type I
LKNKPIRIAINGFGRIGRGVLRAIFESQRDSQFQVVAINDCRHGCVGAELVAHGIQYDSTHGRFPLEVSASESSITIAEQEILLLDEAEPADLPWAELKIDLVIESTGKLNRYTQAEGHLKAGAKKVLISAPAKDHVDATIVFGANQQTLKDDDRIVSNASCTTNCLVPVLQVLNRHFGIEQCFVTTVHAATNDQSLVDGYHRDPRRGRAVAGSMIPTSTGASAGVASVLPEFAGKIEGLSIRVPTQNVSLADLTINLSSDTTSAQVNRVLQDAASGEYRGILNFETAPLVSVDYNHNAYSSNVDAALTNMLGARSLKLGLWYDNEWGFSNRLLDTAAAMIKD